MRVHSLHLDSPAYTFASEIRGRGRLKKSQVPVLLLAPPERLEPMAQRAAHRVTVCLRGLLKWRHPSTTRVMESCPAVLTNLSGGGAQVFLRRRPAGERVSLTVDLPASFVTEVTRRQWRRETAALRRPDGDALHEAAERLRGRYRGIEARVASTRLHLEDERGSVFAVSLARSTPTTARASSQRSRFSRICALTTWALSSEGSSSTARDTSTRASSMRPARSRWMP